MTCKKCDQEIEKSQHIPSWMECECCDELNHCCPGNLTTGNIKRCEAHLGNYNCKITHPKIDLSVKKRYKKWFIKNSSQIKTLYQQQFLNDEEMEAHHISMLYNFLLFNKRSKN